MRKHMLAASLATCALLAPAAASASVYSDEMAKCLVSHSTPADNATFVQWVFAAMSAHPAVKPLTNVTDAERDEFSRKVVQVMERLLMQDCRKESIMAVKVDGVGALQTGFELVGKVAFSSLMSDPATTAQLNKLVTYTDKAKWAALMSEAGVPAPSK